jgi:hypothetical protein
MTPLEVIGYLFTSAMALMAFSLLYKNNPFFRIAENILVAGLVGYGTVLAFRTVWTKGVIPALGGDLVMVISLIVGSLIYLRITDIKQVQWFGRIPVMILVGTGLGASLRALIQAQLTAQIVDTMRPLYVAGDFVKSIGNIIIVVGVISTIFYFYYSREQKGPLQKVSKIGQYVMMIAFGANYGYAFTTRFTQLITPVRQLVSYPGYYMIPIAVIILVIGIWRSGKKEVK